MKNTPIVMLCGPAGSGKDTTAKLIQKFVPNTVLIAQAAPLKDLGRDLFTFTEDQLYGPSECRNAPDPRFSNKGVWTEMRYSKSIDKWLDTNFGGFNRKTVRDNFNMWFDRLQQDTQLSGVDLTPRYMLQTLGTEFGRVISPDVWANIAMQKGREKLYTEKADLVVITDGRFRNEVLNAKQNNAMVVLVTSPETTEVTGGVKGHASEAQLKGIPQFWYDYVIVNMKQFGLTYYEREIETFCGKNFNGVIF